uniref:helix-turn-helix transcriptional regulator n=1 Tax=Acidihalobacter yilgarnensis TaxID=2819280 RepID=UPI000A51E6D3|nr:YafY family protein [Acidihalobacter yilgarnensis]
MRRADRLFLIVHALRGRRTALTARALAETLGVSLRTVYRDIADLQLSGIPIEGEAGIGYVLRKGADIPPLMFSAAEIEALAVGARFVCAFAGGHLATGARAAMLKIDAVIPSSLRLHASRTRVFAPPKVWYEATSGMIDRLHEAIHEYRVLHIDYRDESGRESRREIEPLCLAFWGMLGPSAPGAGCARTFATSASTA